MTLIDEETQEMMARIDSGEMKIVEATVKLVVPEYISLDIVKENVDSGVSYIIEEHCFFIDDGYEEVEDNITLLDITVVDVKPEGKNNDR